MHDLNRWVKEIDKVRGTPVANCRRFLFPVNCSNVHWILFEVVLTASETATITCYDSHSWKKQSGGIEAEFCTYFQRFIRLLTGRISALGLRYNFSYLYRRLDIPGQYDDIHCGLYVLAYIDLLVRREAVRLSDFTYNDVGTIKDYWTFSILKKEYISPFA